MFVKKKIQIAENFYRIAGLLPALLFAFSATLVSASTHTVTQANDSVSTSAPTSVTAQISENESEEKTKAEENAVSEDLPLAPEVESSIFKDPEIWYKSTEGIFTWTLSTDINAVAIGISTSSENKPELNDGAVFEPPVNEFKITSDHVQDGIQYLNIKFKNQAGWGAVLNRKIQIDTTTPEYFDILVQADTALSSFPVIYFEAKDVTSGIDYYEIIISNFEPVKITANEARSGYQLKDLEDGNYLVRVIAYDKAGNIKESNREVVITAGWIKPIEERSFWSYINQTNIFIFLLIVLALFQFAYILHKQKQIRIKEEKLRRENREVQSQMEKIFSALRDEIYDQINMITKRKRLSKNEKDAVKGLNQALEISETLIEKEINDVNSILK